MKIRIAIVTDIHWPGSSEKPEIRGDLAENLLLRVVNRFNRWIKPDIAIIGGDIVNDSESEVALAGMEKIRQILDKLKCPYIAVRGNHDAGGDEFYKILGGKDELGIKGFRFVTFDDRQEPNYCASRTAEQIERFKSVRADHNGPVIAVQHVPLFPPGMSDCPYNYTNAEQIISEMKKYKVFLSISGHYHKGVELIKSEGMNFVTAPALCESPFNYMVIDTDGEEVSAATDCFQMPPELGLVDRHIHTQLAYCSENMDVASVMKFYKDFGIAGVVFTEHTGQLYFDAESFWDGKCYINGLADVNEKNNRMPKYFELMKRNNIPAGSVGLEVDFDYSDKAMIKPVDKAGTGFLLGSIHKFQNSQNEQEFLRRTEVVVKSGANVLAHPFRLFSRAGIEPATEIIDKVVALLRKSGIAAEINFHTQETPIEFVEKCVNSGVKLCLASDSHNMCEVGELWPHLKLLEKAGVSAGDLGRILL